MPETAEQTPEQVEILSSTPTEQFSEQDRTKLDEKIIELRKTGLSEPAIARELKLSRSWVTRSLNRSLKKFAKGAGLQLSVSREEIIQKIFHTAPRALNRIETLMDGASKDEVKLKAATDLLDRAGFAPVQKTITMSMIEEMPHDELIAGIRSALGLAGTAAELVGTDTSPVVEVARTADTMPVVNTNPVTSQSMPVDSATTAAPIPPPLATPTTSRPDATP